MKIAHFSDLHLDSPFAWAGATGGAARQRRQALRDTLVRIVDLTREVNADALFCGGDLYEQDCFRPDTAEFLKDTFAGLAPIPVYIAPGNHDWYGPQSLYAQVDWSENVHIFREAALCEVELEDGLWLWGAAHLAPANTGNFLAGVRNLLPRRVSRGVDPPITDSFLDDFRVERSGIHIALFHGAERSWFAEQGAEKQPHAAFDAAEIEAAGFAHAFLGHYHRPKEAGFHTYPGNPDPLTFGEDGELRALYPPDWPEISRRIRFERAGNRCEWCRAENYQPHPDTGSKVILTVAHLDHNPANSADDNLAALCQRCHNQYDAPKRASNRKHNAHRAAGQLPLFEEENAK